MSGRSGALSLKKIHKSSNFSLDEALKYLEALLPNLGDPSEDFLLVGEYEEPFLPTVGNNDASSQQQDYSQAQ